MKKNNFLAEEGQLLASYPTEARPKADPIELGNWVRKRKKWIKKRGTTTR